MDQGISLTMLKRATLSLTAMLALGSALHQVSAAVDDSAAAPGAEDSFSAAFEPFAGNNEPVAVPPDAVDLTAIDPVEEKAGSSLGRGMASYYGKSFAGRRTASGEAFDPQDLTAAHRTLPFGSRVRVTNPRNGRSVVVRINDRGPFTRGRTIDLSQRAAEQVGIVQAGHGEVELTLLTEL